MKSAPIKSIMSYKFTTDLSPKRPSPNCPFRLQLAYVQVHVKKSRHWI